MSDQNHEKPIELDPRTLDAIDAQEEYNRTNSSCCGAPLINDRCTDCKENSGPIVDEDPEQYEYIQTR